MAAKKNTTAMDYIVARLKKNPKATYASIKEGAAKQRLTIYPVMYGRAQLLLGLVKAKHKKKKKTAAKKKATATAGRKVARRAGKRAGRRASRAGTSPLAAVQELLSGLKAQERANQALRATLVRIRDLIDRVA